MTSIILAILACSSAGIAYAFERHYTGSPYDNSTKWANLFWFGFIALMIIALGLAT